MEHQLNPIANSIKEISISLLPIANFIISAIIALAAIYTVLAALRSARSSEESAREMRASRMDQYKPEIEPIYGSDFYSGLREPKEWVFMLQNSGKGVAQNLEILDREHSLEGELSLAAKKLYPNCTVFVRIFNEWIPVKGIAKNVVVQYQDVNNRTFIKKIELLFELDEHGQTTAISFGNETLEIKNNKSI